MLFKITMRHRAGKLCCLASQLLYGTTALFTYGAERETSYSPYTSQSHPTTVYWGDTHVHTSLSADAYGYGKNRTFGPEQAYRFAQGEEITAHNGMQVKLRRALDFLVIADHSDGMGVLPGLERKNPTLLESKKGRELYIELQDILDKPGKVTGDKQRLFDDFSDVAEDDQRYVYFALHLWGLKGIDAFRQSTWESVTSMADRYNAPGKFTAFAGYEWSGKTHRVVIFKDSAEKTNQVLPLSASGDSFSKPKDLWQSLDVYEKTTGGEALAIPHNANFSRGTAFAPIDIDGKPIDKHSAKLRQRWEPLYEVTQIKGDTEAYPLLSPTDEFADYETFSWYKGDIAEKTYEYARPALKLGLQQQHLLGVNPFKFGLIGSSDSHTSLAAVDENNYWGKQAFVEPNAKRIYHKRYNWRMNAAGYAGVWAEENTREALFAAMKRKEVYASTGPRITLRFFGGWDYLDDDAYKPDLALIGYEKGVPMGGDLTQAPKGKAPSFLIRAVKDPDGANLDRVQVIKGWRDEKGELHEKIYNVALSDSRKVGWNGKVKPVGSTVDIADASYTNTIGDPELATVWQDPDFNQDELAFYYLRVLEIPTPRWTAYDAKFFGIKNIPDEVPMVTQERAYSSPIWYSPSE